VGVGGVWVGGVVGVVGVVVVVVLTGVSELRLAQVQGELALVRSFSVQSDRLEASEGIIKKLV